MSVLGRSMPRPERDWAKGVEGKKMAPGVVGSDSSSDEAEDEEGEATYGDIGVDLPIRR
jgi:hypothetical protein